ncbi:MAG: roadblock/LC7 domain-containing protein [Promethearchaeota archaeon]|jgi:predicted regulator of Ras-like GTPase activity (Roadblock/LC7/MglB family)
MNGPPKINNHNINELSLMLNDLKEKWKFKGIIFANRNGEIIYENVGKNIDWKKFTSMCASVFESAVGLGETMGNQKIGKIITELEKISILMVEIKEKKVFLIFIINNQTDSSFIFDYMEEFIRKINLLI